MTIPDISFSAGPLPAAQTRTENRPATGLMASGALHVAAVALLLLVVPPALKQVREPQSISVEILSPGSFAALLPAQPEAPAEAPTPDQPSTPGPAHAGSASKTYTATNFYAAGVLKEAGIERIRRTLSSFADSEKVVQLCNIEGLEQIRRAAPDYDPDTLVSYATSDPITQGLTLIAKGAAFRSRRRWYGISFSCTAAPDLDGVTAFAFQLGDEIPQSQWEADNLNAADSDE